MNTFTGRLDQLEAKLQIFIEDKLSRLSHKRGSYEGLSRQLVAAMRTGTISTSDGTLLAPDQFVILAHPTQVEFLGEDSTQLADLAELIQEIGAVSGLHFGQSPVITIASNTDVTPNRIDVIARISDKALGNTTDLSISASECSRVIPSNAFLIVNGTEIFPLDQVVINIGRRPNNHLIINDPRVSRQHAQIRATQGRYEIFDLDSTGGTFINQKRITQSLLRPGDVISLAGVHIIYGQERSTNLGKTKELAPVDNLDWPIT